MNLKLIESIAKETLEKKGHHIPMIIAMKPDKSIDMILLQFTNDKEKDMQLKLMRKKISKEKINRYWVIMEAWVGNNPLVRPSRDFEKTESIIILEFDRKTMSKKLVMLPFERKDKRIIWKERSCKENGEDCMDHFYSTWDFYKEDVSEEVFNKIQTEEINRKIDNMPKDQMDKILKEARKTFHDDTLTEETLKKELKKHVKKLVFNNIEKK